MPSVTLTLPKEVKSELKEFIWINWSEVARESFLEAVKRQEALQKLNELFKNSKLTDEDCLRLGEQVKEDLYKRLKKEGKV